MLPPRDRSAHSTLSFVRRILQVLIIFLIVLALIDQKSFLLVRPLAQLVAQLHILILWLVDQAPSERIIIFRVSSVLL